jgi:zinc transporter ZupT
MAVSAGGFLYIAAADLLPELHRRKGDGNPFVKLATFSAGLGVIALLGLIAH